MASRSTRPATSAAKDSENYYKTQLEAVTKEKNRLKEKLQILERENHDLRKSVYELSLKRSNETYLNSIDLHLFQYHDRQWQHNMNLTQSSLNTHQTTINSDHTQQPQHTQHPLPQPNQHQQKHPYPPLPPQQKSQSSLPPLSKNHPSLPNMSHSNHILPSPASSKATLYDPRNLTKHKSLQNNTNILHPLVLPPQSQYFDIDIGLANAQLTPKDTSNTNILDQLSEIQSSSQNASSLSPNTATSSNLTNATNTPTVSSKVIPQKQVTSLSKAFPPLNRPFFSDAHNVRPSRRALRSKLMNSQPKFMHRFNMDGHTSAVYTALFSPCGKFIGSGSLDRSIRLWSVQNPTDPPIAIYIDAHYANVFALDWSLDSSALFSGGFDGFMKEWDIDAQAPSPVYTFNAKAFVNNIKSDPLSPHLLYVATSRNFIYLVDRRIDPHNEQKNHSNSTVVATILNDANINTLHVQHDAKSIISGDQLGFLKTYDVRKLNLEQSTSENSQLTTPLDVLQNDPDHSSITHIQASPTGEGDEDEGSFLAVNSFDNYIRMYDRGSFLLGSTGLSSSVCIHCLRGPAIRNWPIRSSFFRGSQYQPFKSVLADKNNIHHEDDEVKDLRPLHSDDFDFEKTDRDLHSRLLLASASADTDIYLYDVGNRQGSAELIQVLKGHTSRVYSVHFHPFEPICVSAGADSVLKLWAPSKKASPT